MMAEYYALSTCMRKVLPTCDLIKIIAKGAGLNGHCATTFRTRVREDNNSALSLANMAPGEHTPRSKFYNCKVHWFWSHLHNGANHITVQNIDTTEQLADLFTKPLPHEPFEALQKKLMGW